MNDQNSYVYIIPAAREWNSWIMNCNKRVFLTWIKEGGKW